MTFNFLYIWLKKDAPADLNFTVEICSVCMENTTLVPEAFLEIFLRERESKPRRKRRNNLNKNLWDQGRKTQNVEESTSSSTIAKKRKIINWLLSGWFCINLKCRTRLFKGWIRRISIRETNCVIHWIVVYTVDFVLQLLNNWDHRDRQSRLTLTQPDERHTSVCCPLSL